MYIYAIKKGIDSDFARLVAGIVGCFMIYGLALLAIRNSFVWKIKSIIQGFVFKK